MIEFWVYGRSECKYCEAAKLMLHTKNIEFSYLDVGKNPSWMPKEFRTVPQIFHLGKHIGGFEALAEYLEKEYLVG